MSSRHDLMTCRFPIHYDMADWIEKWQTPMTCTREEEVQTHPKGFPMFLTSCATLTLPRDLDLDISTLSGFRFPILPSWASTILLASSFCSCNARACSLESKLLLILKSSTILPTFFLLFSACESTFLPFFPCPTINQRSRSLLPCLDCRGEIFGCSRSSVDGRELRLEEWKTREGSE